MGLKQIIKQQKILRSGAVDLEMQLPGEPLIYCIKYPIGARQRGARFFRNEKWRSLLKCYFPSYYGTKTPVVLLIRFYVSPPDHVNVSKANLKREKTPAVYSYEVCDYLLSFLEMIHHVLINSYRQIVKVDVEKYYSANPRTVFKFMKWDHYDYLQNHNTVHPQGEELRQTWENRELVQPDLQGDGSDSGICQESTPGQEPSTQGPVVSDCALPDSCASEDHLQEACSSTFATALQET